jgi:hypothetical protein
VFVLKTGVVFLPAEWVESYSEVGSKLKWTLLIPNLLFISSSIFTKISANLSSASKCLGTPDHSHLTLQIAIIGS